jgi:hypothetical protein
MHQTLHKSAPTVINSFAQHVPRDKEHDGGILETKCQMSKEIVLKKVHLDAHDALGARVIGHFQACAHLHEGTALVVEERCSGRSQHAR